MKRLLTVLIMLSVLAACQKRDELDQQAVDGLEELKTLAVVGNDSIVPLDSTLFPERATRGTANRLASVFDNLYQLDGMTFYLQPKNVYLGLNTLQTTGLGQEVVLGTQASGNNNQLFYLQFLPPSSGIPYLIRSYALGEVIGAGSYPSDPNTYVLYTRQSGSTSLFGFSWDFYLNDDENGYIIENQDLLGTGTGGPWDIYYYALNAQTGNISFVRRNNASIYQQFNIVPNDEFQIQSAELDFDNAVITGTAPYMLRDGTVTNNTSSNVTHNLQFTESEAEQSAFRNTTGITTNLTSNISVGLNLFNIVDIGGSLSIQEGSSQTVEYSSTGTRTISVQESYTITVPPETVVSYEFMAVRHQVNIGYSAELYGVTSTNTITVTGVYSGVDYSSTFLEVTETPIAGRAGATRTYTVYPDGHQE